MRISTSQIYDAGTLGIQRNQSELLKLQNQVSTGRKVLTPADDPVAAAQALVVTQSAAVNGQHQTNQVNATSQLGLVDSQLTSLTNLLQNVRDRVVQAGGGALANSDRLSIATELEASLSEMMGIANSDNGTGDFLFSGYQGGTRPFAIDATQAVVPPATTAPVGYFGDDGERLLQVSSSRQMAVSVAGSDVFMSGSSGNGTFVAATGGNVGVSAISPVTSTATVDAGAVMNRAQWTAALTNADAGKPLEIRFSAPVAPAVAPAVSYGIYDPVSTKTTGPFPYVAGAAISLTTAGDASATPPIAAVNFGAQVVVSGVPVVGDSFTIQPSINKGSATSDPGSVLDAQKWSAAVNNPAAGQPLEVRFSVAAGVTRYGIYDPVGGLSSLQTYTPGQAIPLISKNGVDFGSQVVVSGAPANGDTLTVTPSSSQSMFQTMQNLIGILKGAVGATTYTRTQLANDLAGQLSNIDQAMSQVSQVQASVGTSMREVDSLSSAASDLQIQYKATLSDLQDLDYAKALSDFTKQNVSLEAAQKSFVQISGLSLFKYI